MVVAKHLDRDHGERFALRGINLSRHDRRAWFVCGNLEFAESRTRTRGIPTNIVGDLQERARERAEHSAHTHHAIVRRERRELVRSRNKRFASLLRDSPRGDLPKARIGVEPRADRRVFAARTSRSYRDAVMVGRTHLQDATALTLGQMISGWVAASHPEGASGP